MTLGNAIFSPVVDHFCWARWLKDGSPSAASQDWVIPILSQPIDLFLSVNFLAFLAFLAFPSAVFEFN
jgi:hypothetical protein